jgi:hypothetical protein
VSDDLHQLVDSLLYEGYALYPYTPEATKNATPTPFGIVYPPVYAAALPSTSDHLEMRCAFEGDGEVSAELWFLAPSGERHQAERHHVALPPGIAELEFAAGELSFLLSLAVSGGVARFRVENLTEVPEGLDRAGALMHSLISTHPLLRISGGRFVSPLDSGLASVNTWPVLAEPGDMAMLGAAIVLPDYPQLAPESLGSLFDNTEIEEALVLHVKALSEGERDSIAGQDPAVREMVERAAAATPEELLNLHGRVTLRDPVTSAPPEPSAAVRDPTRGEAQATVDGVTFRRGGRVVLRPSEKADLQARVLEGHEATIERIYVDYDGKVHLGVTVADVPGQDLMRDTGRFLYFFAPEVEVIA